MRSLLSWCELTFLSLLLGSTGCGSSQSADERETSRNVEVQRGQCHAAADCDSGQSCAPTDENAARRSLLIVAPCMTPQPVYVQCGTDAECSEGQICTTDKDPVPASPFVGGCPHVAPSASVCNTACTDATCPLGTRCEQDGHCRLVPCDDPDGMCPEGFTCDPQTAALGLTANEVTVPGGLTTEGVALALSSAIVDLHRSGCLLLHCDEAGSLSCSPGYLCDRALAGDKSVGCAVLNCHDWGQCSSESYICEPTSSNPRVAGMDVHGCSLKNCEEGFDCGAARVCDFNRPDADEWGCAFVQCDEGGAMPCSAGYSCQPGHQFADAYGCVSPAAVPSPSGVAPSNPVPSPISTNPNDGASGASNPSEAPAAPGPEPGGSPGAGSLASSGGASSDDDAIGPIPDVRPEGEPIGSVCVDDVDCQTGFCVNQTCEASLGQCQ